MIVHWKIEGFFSEKGLVFVINKISYRTDLSCLKRNLNEECFPAIQHITSVKYQMFSRFEFQSPFFTNFKTSLSAFKTQSLLGSPTKPCNFSTVTSLDPPRALAIHELVERASRVSSSEDNGPAGESSSLSTYLTSP